MGRARNGTNSTVVDFALSTFAARDSTNLNMLAKCQTQRVLSTHEKFSFVNLCLDETVVCEDATLASLYFTLQALDSHAARYLL